MSSSDSATPRAYHHGNLRQALLDAASTLLSESPADRLSLREIARAAQVSHAAPYHYFSDRDAMLHALATESMRRMLQLQADAAAARTDDRERLIAIGMGYITFAARKPHAFALIFDPRICPPGNPQAEMAALTAANEALLLDAVARAEAAGVLAAGNREDAANALWGTVHGIAHLVMAGHLPLAAAEPALHALLPRAR